MGVVVDIFVVTSLLPQAKLPLCLTRRILASSLREPPLIGSERSRSCRDQKLPHYTCLLSYSPGPFTGKVRGGSAPARAIQPVAASAFQPQFKLDILLVVESCNPVRENRQVSRIWHCEPVGLVTFVFPPFLSF